MATPTLDVVGIGNAIVDVLAQADESFIQQEKLAKGTMALIDEARADSALRQDGVGDGSFRRLGRQHHRRRRLARRQGRLYRQGRRR